MTKDQVGGALVKVLEIIQVNSGLPCPKLEKTLRPAKDLEKFDSKVWPVAIGMLSAELHIEIDDNINIFASKDGTEAYTIDEVTNLVCKVAEHEQEPEEVE